MKTCILASVFTALLTLYLTLINFTFGLNEEIKWKKTSDGLTHDIEDEQLFRRFVIRYNRTYVNNKEEFKKRSKIFKQSLRRQASLNDKEKKLGGTARYGVNQFSDWTTAEFQAFLKNGNKGTKHICDINGPCCHQPAVLPNEPIPIKHNWASLGKVTGIKNQGNCGSCWAFSGAEIVETQWAIKRDKLTALSVQELVDCSEKNGCDGGDTCNSLKWLQDNNFTLVEASDYPYKDSASACKKDTVLKDTGVKIKYPCGCTNVSEMSVMMPLIAFHGTWAVDVDATMWHDYLGGIIQHHCSDVYINHAVQITGYDTTGQVPYWILRNSWGTSFGMDGYLHVAMGKNLCDISVEKIDQKCSDGWLP